MNEYLSVYGTFFASQDTKSEERGEEGQEDYSGVGRRRSVFEQMKNIPTAGISSDSPRRPSLRRNSISSENNQSQIDLGGSQVRKKGVSNHPSPNIERGRFLMKGWPRTFS